MHRNIVLLRLSVTHSCCSYLCSLPWSLCSLSFLFEDWGCGHKLLTRLPKQHLLSKSSYIQNILLFGVRAGMIDSRQNSGFWISDYISYTTTQVLCCALLRFYKKNNYFWTSHCTLWGCDLGVSAVDADGSRLCYKRSPLSAARWIVWHIQPAIHVQ